MICVGDTERMLAAVVFPCASRMDTVVPDNCVGKGAVAEVVAVAIFCPAAMASDPAAIDVAPGFAAEKISGTLTAGVAPAAGVRHTPRKTSPAFALRIVVNCSPAATLGSMFASTSVIATSLFGSAPGSPLLEIVEVIPQIVTVPSPFTLPAILRIPSVAGF